MGGLSGPRSIQEALRVPRMLVTRMAHGGGFRAVAWSAGMPIPRDRGALAHSERHMGLDISAHRDRVAGGGPEESGTFATEADAVNAVNEALGVAAGAQVAENVLDRGQDRDGARVRLSGGRHLATTAFRSGSGAVFSSDFFHAYGVFFLLKRLDANHAVVQTAYPLTAEKV